MNAERLQYAKETEQKAIEKGDSLLLAEAWYLYGKTYAFAGDYKFSQSYFLKSLHILERRPDSYELSRLYVRLSENEAKQGRHKKALNYAEMALRIAKGIQSDQGLMRAYGALGNTYEQLRENPSKNGNVSNETVLFCYKQIESIGLKLKDTLAVAEAMTKTGTFLAENKDIQSIVYLKKALHLFTLKDKGVGRLRTMLHLGSAYLLLGQPDQAWTALHEAEVFYDRKKINEYDIRVLLESEFVRYFERTGQWEKAYERFKKLSELERRQLLSDYDGTVMRINVEYETERKEALLKAQDKVIALDAKNLLLQQRVSVIASALFITAAAMSLIFFRLYRKNQRISRRNEDLVKEQNHRVKNNLQIVSSLLRLQAKQLTDEAARKAVDESRLRIESMAILHRRLYDGDKLAEVNLDEFIREVVEGVLKTYGYSFVQTSFSIDNISLSADKAVPVGLIMNELATNACKYAFSGNENPILSVNGQLKKSKVVLSVADNGPGWSEAQSKIIKADDTLPATDKESFGMQLIQAQVEQLYGTYQFKAGNGVLFTMEFNV
ncbi:histidine kinase dimerization/phosphoacceptor domain -containing protein [Spirosoma sp.]|uniref:histidine kinase dimerization/phosphoacceptor domain -containing protein n=1 Tax=Spirosoma sp. TaxID=1899569 RepID=UPI003B3B35C9